MKTCNRCKKEKPLEAFAKNSANKDGKSNRCRECYSVITKALVKQGYFRRKYAKNRERILAKRYHATPKCRERSRIYRDNKPRKHKSYKIRQLNVLTNSGSLFTIDNYEAEIEKCRNTCMICKKDAITNGKALAVDHDHTTGVYRGMLCMSCNLIIGMVNEDTEILEKIINYLKTSKNAS